MTTRVQVLASHRGAATPTTLAAGGQGGALVASGGVDVTGELAARTS